MVCFGYITVSTLHKNDDDDDDKKKIYKRMWNINYVIIPVITGATGIVTGLLK